MKSFLLYVLSFTILIGCTDKMKDKATREVTYSSQSIDSNKAIVKEDKYKFDSLNSEILLKRIFDNCSIDTLGMALWVPTYVDLMKGLVLSYDGKCHTAVDTIMYFKDCKDRCCAVVIFAHYNYVKDGADTVKPEITGSHFEGVPLGIALFCQNKDGKWKPYQINKYFAELGYFGKYRTGRSDAGHIYLKEIGDRWTCLSLFQGIGGSSGEFWGYESLFAIEEHQIGKEESGEEGDASRGADDHLIQRILFYRYSFTYASFNRKRDIDSKTSMRIIKKKNDYFDIDLVTTRNRIKTTKRYHYDEDVGKYVVAR